MKEKQGGDMIVVPRKILIDLLNQECRMRYMLTILGGICHKKGIQYMLTPEDVCDFLGIDYKAFRETLAKVSPRSTRWEGGRVYSLDSMVSIAERVTRTQRLKNLHKPIKK